MAYHLAIYTHVPSPQGDYILYVNEHISYKAWSTFPERVGAKKFPTFDFLHLIKVSYIWLKFDPTFEIFSEPWGSLKYKWDLRVIGINNYQYHL